jgi:hypothetical protein
VRAETRAAAGIALAALVGLAPLTADGAACCVSSTSGGVGRLRIWEDFAIGVSSAVSVGVGHWSADSEWKPYGDTYSELEWRSSLWSLVRLWERGEVQLLVPAVLNHRTATGTEATGGMVGDILVGLRYEPVAIGEYHRAPGVALVATLLAPTGRSADRSSEPLAVDVTGRGAAVLGLAATLEWTRLPWFVQFTVGATLPLPFERADTGLWQWFGPGVQLTAVTGVEVVPSDLVLDVTARFGWESPLRIDGDVVDGSERTDLALGIGLSWLVNPHWTLTASAETGIFASDFGDNSRGLVTTSLGVRYGYF